MQEPQIHNGVLLDPHAPFSGMLQAPIESVAAELPLLLMAVAIGFSFAIIGRIRASVSAASRAHRATAAPAPQGRPSLRRRSF
jgi:hypothetical protein